MSFEVVDVARFPAVLDLYHRVGEARLECGGELWWKLVRIPRCGEPRHTSPI